MKRLPYFSCVVLIGLVLCQGWSLHAASAQSPAEQSGMPVLAPEQKLLIFQSVSAMHRNSAAPPGFRAAVGAQVPRGIELQPMPGVVAGLIPSIKDMDVAMIEKQVVVVDPKSRTVLAVVTQAE